MEGELRRLLQLAKEAGRSVTLTFLVKGGKTRAKLEVDFDSEPEPPSSTPAAVAAPRRRQPPRGAASQQVSSQPESPPPSSTEGEAGEPPRPPRRPLKHLPHAPDGRQAVLHVAKPAMPSFASLNMDGSPPSLPPRPPPPPSPTLQVQSTSILKVWPFWRMQSKDPDLDMKLINMPFNDKIAVASVRLGVERYRWKQRDSLWWPDPPPWHSSSR